MLGPGGGAVGGRGWFQAYCSATLLLRISILVRSWFLFTLDSSITVLSIGFARSFAVASLFGAFCTGFSGSCSCVAASLLFARGTPCLYYGDELGLEGAPGGPLGDNAMRQKVDLRETLANGNAHARFEATSRLVHLRQSHAALRDATSAQTTLVLTNETFAFARKSSCGATALVAFNCSGNAATVHLPVGEKVGMADGTMLSEPLGGSGATAHSGMIALDLPPNSVRVLGTR